MFRSLLVLVAIIACINAFSVSSMSRRASSLMMAEKSQSVPFLPAPKGLDSSMPGYKGFDPLGLATYVDPRYMQEAEIKHCRTAMLGWAGFVASEFVKLPGEIHQVSAVEAHDVAVKSGALYQVLVVVVLLEFINIVAIKEMLEGSGRQPGEFGFDPLGFTKGKSDTQKKDLANKEIENGRAAMLAFGGVVTQAVLTGKGFPYF